MSGDYPNMLPQHVAVIMDGNGRWAHAKKLPRTAGHKKGVDAARKIVEAAVRVGVKSLTLFAFSSENWRRPEEEVSALMDLFVSALKREAQSLANNGVRMQFIGAREAFSKKLQNNIRLAEQETAHGNNMTLNIAANYGGRWDIAQAAKAIAHKVQAGELTLDDVDAQAMHNHMCMADQPEVDLLIRTGGEQRVSNFVLWQAAYAELYFTDVYWPDFDEIEFKQAIEEYAQRQRRFGMTGEQVVGHA